jgi:hypothetical protein
VNAKVVTLFFVGAFGLFFSLAALVRYSLVMIFAEGFAVSAGSGGFIDEVTLSSGTVWLGSIAIIGSALAFGWAQREKSSPSQPMLSSAPRGFAIDSVHPKMT